MPGLNTAAVIPTGPSAESKTLCCAYVPESAAHVSVEAMKAYLKVLFPDYMIPSAYKELHQLPRNTNDKIDRKALAAMFTGQRVSTGAGDDRGPFAAMSKRAADARTAGKVAHEDVKVGPEIRFIERVRHIFSSLRLRMETRMAKSERTTANGQGG